MVRTIKYYQLAFILFFFFSHFLAFTQDKIITIKGDTIKCDITKIANDTVYVSMERNNIEIKTFLLKSDVREYKFFYVDFFNNNSDSSITYKFTLNDGNVFKGNVTGTTNQQIILWVKSVGEIIIPAINIIKTDKITRENINENGWFPNPNETRYLFAPSAFNLKRGEGYYQNAYLFVNSFNVGVTDYLSLGGGFEILSTFSRDIRPIAYFTPKVGFQVSKKIGVGAGVIIASFPEVNNAGIIYGVGTYGDIEKNISIGIGTGFFDSEFYEKPIIAFNGMWRVRPKLSLVTENWLFFSDEITGIYSYGIRFFGEKLSVDFALLNNTEIFDLIPIGIPYVDFVVKF